MSPASTVTKDVEAEVDLSPSYTLQPSRKTPVRWPLQLLATGSTGLIGTGAAPLLIGGGDTTMSLAAAISAGACAGTVTFSVRNQRRAEISGEALASLERVAGPVRSFRCRIWRGWFVGAPRVVRFRYHPGAVLTRQAWPHAAAAAMTTTLGGTYRVSRHDPRRGLITLRWKEVIPDAIVDPRETRASELMRQLFGQTATVKTTIDERGPHQVSVQHDCGVKATFGSWREKVERVVSTMLEGRWRARWDLQNDRVKFELRPEVASFIKRGAPTVDRQHPDYYKIPLGADCDGNEVSWNLDSSMPHFLTSGKTGKGKTVVLRGVAMEVAARQLKVWTIDPKRVELIALRGWPNVQIVATTIEQQVVTLLQAWQIMEDRYQAIEAGGSEDDFDMLVLILDEFAEFSRRVTQWWVQIKRPGMPSVCPIFEKFDSLVRLGRTAGIRVAIGIQRPDARFFGESAEARDNFDSRLSLGRLSPDGSRMMWGSSIGTSLPGVRGRAIACTSEDDAAEIQAYWVPDPRRIKPGEDGQAEQMILDRLRPSTTTYEQLQVRIPEPDVDDKGREMVWEAILAATMQPIAAARPASDDYLDDTLVDVAGDLPDADSQDADGQDTEATDKPATTKHRPARAAAGTISRGTGRGKASSGHGTTRSAAAPVSGKAGSSRGDDRSATIVPFPTRTDADQDGDDGLVDQIEADQDDDQEEYGPADHVRADAVEDGDLVLIDDRWVVVEAAETDFLDDAAIVLAWRSVDEESDEDGTETLPRAHTLRCRHPLG